jgi:hypothetical protein
MENVIEALNQMYQRYQSLYPQRNLFFEKVLNTTYFNKYFLVPRAELSRYTSVNDDFCLRAQQYYAEKNIYCWQNRVSRTHPIQFDPYIKCMYLEEQKEMRNKRRLAFLSGMRCPSSPIYLMQEPFHNKYILELAGLCV